MKNAALFCAVAGLAFASTASADPVVLQQFSLADHPDGSARPPVYGLRLDNIFTAGTTSAGDTGVAGGVGGITTFSFNHPGAGVILRVLDTTGNGVADAINISGTVFGGVDVGSSYGFGAGLYALDFTFTNDVTKVEGPQGGWTASKDYLGNGSLVALAGNADVAEGTNFNLYQQTKDGAADFEFLRDGHRLGSHPSFMDMFVGRGWLTYHSGGNKVNGTQDFLFVGTIIPLPGSAGLAFAGLGLVALRRRRTV